MPIECAVINLRRGGFPNLACFASTFWILDSRFIKSVTIALYILYHELSRNTKHINQRVSSLIFSNWSFQPCLYACIFHHHHPASFSIQYTYSCKLFCFLQTLVSSLQVFKLKLIIKAQSWNWYWNLELKSHASLGFWFVHEGKIDGYLYT